MRLPQKEIKIIKNKVNEIFGDCIIYLFGSRVDDTKNGGDVDLYIIPKIKENLFKKRVKLKVILEDTLFKPVDIVVSINKNRLIEQEALKGIKI